MTSSLRKIFIIAGPTAAGKTQLAAAVARRIGAEIVGADALQIVQGLDILTAKPSRKLRVEVPHHLIDIFAADEEVNAARYVATANPVLSEIASRGRVALVVGGTGLYLHALMQGLSALPPKQSRLRRDLEQLPTSSLHRLLGALQTERAQAVDRDNKRRLTRALEVLMTNASAGSKSSVQSHQLRRAPNEQFLGGILLTCDRKTLANRVEKRITAMLRDGVVEEFSRWKSTGQAKSPSKVIGYQALADLSAGKSSLRECKELLRRATCDYAKRQMVWFNKYAGLPAAEVSDEKQLEQQEQIVVQTILERAKQFVE